MTFSVIVTRLLLGFVLAGAGLAKLRHPLRFATVLELHGLTLTAAKPVAVGIIGAEIYLGVLHVLGRGGTAVFAATVGLLTVFGVAVTRALLLGVSAPCGCFSSDLQERLSMRSLIRLLALIGAEVFLLHRSLTNDTTWELTVPIAHVPALFIGQAVLLVAIGNWIYRSPEIIGLIRNALGPAHR